MLLIGGVLVNGFGNFYLLIVIIGLSFDVFIV